MEAALCVVWPRATLCFELLEGSGALSPRLMQGSALPVCEADAVRKAGIIYPGKQHASRTNGGHGGEARQVVGWWGVCVTGACSTECWLCAEHPQGRSGRTPSATWTGAARSAAYGALSTRNDRTAAHAGGYVC